MVHEREGYERNRTVKKTGAEQETGHVSVPEQAYIVTSFCSGRTVFVASDCSAACHSCALLSNRTVWCWGRNNHGQLGVTGSAMSDVPVRVVGLPEQL
ncbi:MAG TPA: hypothetical protein ENI88_02620 [Desulfobulbus sp.]|nr:hypothetical protein [Desulfobulbus sp.]